jgi:hypothetical protein
MNVIESNPRARHYLLCYVFFLVLMSAEQFIECFDAPVPPLLVFPIAILGSLFMFPRGLLTLIYPLHYGVFMFCVMHIIILLLIVAGGRRRSKVVFLLYIALLSLNFIGSKFGYAATLWESP